MDALLSRLGAQALNMALRSGIALTSTFAISQCARIMQAVDDKKVVSEFKKLQKQLDHKIKILSPAIDLIEFKSGRGNAFLESAVPLAKSLHQDITALARELEDAATTMEQARSPQNRHAVSKMHEEHLKRVMADVRGLINRIDRDVPTLQLAISASGESLSSSMSPGISPSRYVQASAFLNFGDTQYACDPTRPVQIGPAFTLSLYMLFLGHASRTPTSPPKGNGNQHGFSETSQTNGCGFGDEWRKPLWQEVIHKCRVRVCRTPLDHVFDGSRGYFPKPHNSSDVCCEAGTQDSLFSKIGVFDGFAYHLEIIEDLDDGRVHDDKETGSAPYEGVFKAGIRESVPMHQISKIFYADTGRILNIGNGSQPDNNPVLLLKRDAAAKPPAELRREMVFGSGDLQNEGVEEYQEAGQKSVGSAESLNEQDDVDRQLREESLSALDSAVAEGADDEPSLQSFPAHLDSEWIALEVFEEAYNTDDGDSGSENDVEDIDVVCRESGKEPGGSSPQCAKQRLSLDSGVIDQIRHISLSNSPYGRRESPQPPTFRPPVKEISQSQGPAKDVSSFMARSPFAGVTTSLSLLEMLIRLTSLQEFQQAPHLTIDDHILSFFLEETSTTGLTGEERLRARSEAKRRVGFDPYTDSHGK